MQQVKLLERHEYSGTSTAKRAHEGFILNIQFIKITFAFELPFIMQIN